jgi:hypothetical protein
MTPHVDPKTLSSIRLEYIADISRGWKTYDENVASVLDELHVYGPEFLDTRLRWKEKEPLCVLELRVLRWVAGYVCYRLMFACILMLLDKSFD